MKLDNPQLFKDKERGVNFANVSNIDFRAIYLEGPDGRETKFICNVCDKECSTVHAVKTHITKVHVKGKVAEKDKTEKKDDNAEKVKAGKRRLSSPEVQDKEDKRRKGVKDFNPDDLEYWSKKKTNDNNEPKKSNNVEKDPMEVEMDELSKAAAPRSIPVTEFEEWKAEYVDEMKMKDAKIKSLEEAISNSNEPLNVIKIEKESLEFDNNEQIEKNEEMEKTAVEFKEAFVQMKAEIDRLAALKEKSGDGDMIKTLKKQIKDINKEVTDSNEKKNEALKKLKEETNKRAKLESDNTALRRQMRNMTTIAEEKKREENLNRSRKDMNEDKRRSPEIRRKQNREKSPLFSKRRSSSPTRQHRRVERNESKSQERRNKSRSNQEKRKKSRSSQERKDRRSRSAEGRKSRRSCSQERGRRSSRSSHGNSEIEDCSYWLHGKCHFGKKCTSGAHDPMKEGVKKQQINQDFYQSLVGAPGRGGNQPMMMMVPANQMFGQGALARGFGSR